MRKLIGLLIVGALLGIGQGVSADPMDDVYAAYDSGDYATVLRLVRPMAEQGVPEGQHALAILYSLGRGVALDYKESQVWLRKAAAQGFAASQNRLGSMYEDGEGVLQDYKEAVRWRRLAAEQGLWLAHLNLGFMYERGHGVAQDNSRAHMWFNLAASENSSFAKDKMAFVASMMTPAQIERAQEMARKCQQSKFKDCGW